MKKSLRHIFFLWAEKLPQIDLPGEEMEDLTPLIDHFNV